MKHPTTCYEPMEHFIYSPSGSKHAQIHLSVSSNWAGIEKGVAMPYNVKEEERKERNLKLNGWGNVSDTSTSYSDKLDDL